MERRETAGSVLEADVAGHTNPIGWVRKSILGIPDPDPDPPFYDVRIKVRSTGRIVHSLRFEALHAAEEMGRIEDDLSSMALDDFCERYGITLPS